MDFLINDLRVGLRRMRRDLLLTITATLSLAVGIGANTALYTVARGLLFRAQPGIANPGELVDIGRTKDGYGFNSLSYPDYVSLRERTRSLREIYATNLLPQAISMERADGSTFRVFATFVSSNYFTAIGVVPGAGRVLQRVDGEGIGAAPVVVISDGLWSRAFARSPAVIGSALDVDGVRVTIVGVAAPGFHGTGVRSADAWLPIGALESADAARQLTQSDGTWLLVGGRRREEASVAQVDAELRVLARTLPSAAREPGRGLRAVTASPVPGGAGPLGVFLGLLFAVVIAVLFVACANLSGMLLSRIPMRRGELAVRAAVGASRTRLVRQLLVETVLLFLSGAGAGLIVAAMLMRVAPTLLAALPFPVAIPATVDRETVALATALALVTAIVSGLVPAAQASRVDLGTAMNADRHGSRGARLRRTFVVAQVALSIVLVVVGGLFVRAMLHAGAWAPGFDARGVELVSLEFGPDDSAPTAVRAPTLDALLARVAGIPGVERVSAASSFPGGFEERRMGALRSPANSRQADDGEWNVVSPGYFSTIRMAFRAGRDFTPGDRAGTRAVAIVGEGTAQRLWPGRAAAAAVGEVVEQIGFNPITKTIETLPVAIVGVVADPAYGTLIDGHNDVHVYLPLAQTAPVRTMLVVRTTRGQSAIAAIRAAVSAAASGVTIESTRSAEEYSALGLLPQRVGALVTGWLGLVGLLLAAIGVYGVTASVIAQRRREIGIRIALGASAAAISRMVLRQGMSMVLIGALVGVPLAIAASLIVSSYLAGLPPTDAVTWSAATLGFALMGLLACSAPVMRALRISATETLRES